MVTQKTLKEQLIKLQINYGRDKFDLSKESFNLWYEMFADCEEEALKLAINNCIKGSEYAPNIAGLMKYYKAIMQERSEIIEVMQSQYKTLLAIWGESYNKETVKAIIDYVYSFPKEKRKEAMIDLTHRAVSFYNDCRNEARVDIPRIKEFIEGKR